MFGDELPNQGVFLFEVEDQRDGMLVGSQGVAGTWAVWARCVVSGGLVGHHRSRG